jgi:hypothetical protein
MSSESTHGIPISKQLRARVLYEATLQDLTRAQNYAVDQLLLERNHLLDERYVDLFLCRSHPWLISLLRGKLTGEYIAYNLTDFFTPPGTPTPICCHT